MINTDRTTKFITDRKKREYVDIIYEKPHWIPLIYDKEDRIDGNLLMGYALIPKDRID